MGKHKNIIKALVLLIVAACGIGAYTILCPDPSSGIFMTASGKEIRVEDLPLESTTVESSLVSVGKLTTMEYHFTHTDTYTDTKKFDSNVPIFGGKDIPLTESSFMFKCEGCISVGIDFERITVDVDNIGKVITVNLPEVQIFSCEIDPDKDEFYDEHFSIFNKIDGYDYSKAHNMAKTDEKAKVKTNGTMDSALANAKLLITNMISSLPQCGDYEIVYQS